MFIVRPDHGDILRAFSLAAIALATSSFATASFASSWQAKPMLDPSSPFLCKQADVSTVVLEFSEMGTELTVKTPQNGVFGVAIAADGFINGAIAVPVGRRQFAVDLTGNVKDRALQIYNKEYACRFNLRPLS